MTSANQRRGALGLIVMGLAACGVGDVHLATPDGVADENGLVALASEAARVWAYAGTGADGVLVPLDGELDEALLVLLETPPLESLGIEEGVVRLDGEGACPLQAALSPRRAWTLDGEAWIQTKPSDIPGRFSELMLRAATCRIVDRCLHMTAESSHSFGGALRPFWALSTENGILIGTLEGEMFVAGPDFRAKPLQITPGPTKLRAATLGADGALWFGTQDGEIHRGALSAERELSLELVGRTPGGLLWIAPAGSSTRGADLLTLNAEGALGRFREGEGWVQIFAIAESIPGATISGGLAERAPGDVVVAWASDNRLLRFHDGQVNDVSAEGHSDPPTAIGSFGELGTFAIVGTHGTLLELDGARFKALEPDAQLLSVAHGIVAWNGFVFAGGSSGFVRQHVPGVGFCPNFGTGMSHVRSLVTYGGKLVAIAGHGDGANSITAFSAE
ncbi:MAG: hypothetical protein HYV07_09255 [Deltaproteobacteria bacterium]|nr:hypothetical protein [Deltaproteobacteria bacterium]